MAGFNPMTVLNMRDDFEQRVIKAVSDRHHALQLQMQDRLAQEIINRLGKALEK